MATVLELSALPDPALFKLDAVLEPREQESRCIYVSRRVMEKMRTELPLWSSQWGLHAGPAAQLSARVSQFISGETLISGEDFAPIHKYRDGYRNYDDGIWEIKTADVRVFGWFWKLDWFIAAAIDQAWRVKDSNLYAGYRDEVVRFRSTLNLDEPKFIPGGDPAYVVSDSYPA